MEIIILIVASLVLGLLGKKMGLALVVGQLLAGIVLGPAGLDLLSYTHLLAILAEGGVLLLMFNAGKETNIRGLWQEGRMASAVAILGVLFPVVIFYFAAIILGYGNQEAILWGITFAATSISITIAVLAEQRLLAKRLGTVILGAAILDDFLALGMISIYTLFVGTKGMNLSALLPLFAFLIGLLGQRVIVSSKLKFTDTLGEYVFYPIFFGSIGLRIALGQTDQTWPVLVGLIVLAILTKIFGAGLGAYMTGANLKLATAIGAGMVSRGEMALIIASLGLAAGIVDQGVFSELVLVIIITTIMAPIIMRPLFSKADS
ncbi:Na/H antiporter [Weissella oryzae SG25]|uniref:Na/H antiporter n=1 Tax=Weissella oryzae (strain DSM 25784 / JCM 18191 / LMG 30913 / SG25) TaxID=1329250 RepID=A0A069CZB1_WEIOS|nr:cation:proton antiporter [Weissella oryzae]GAK30406.1 Na/H antiporter [Weissella oryzae SG25]